MEHSGENETIGKIKSWFKREKPKQKAEPEMSWDEAHALEKKFLEIMYETGAGWDQDYDKFSELINNPVYGERFNMMSDMAAGIKRYQDRLEIGREASKTDLMRANFLLLDNKDVLPEMVETELKNDKAGFRSTIEAVVGLADMRLSTGADRELFACLRGKVEQAFTKLMQFDYRSQFTVFENETTALQLLDLAMKYGSEEEKKFAEKKADEYLFLKGHVTAGEAELASELINESGSVLSRYCKEKVKNFFNDIGLDYSTLSVIWQWNQFRGHWPALSKLSNIRETASLAGLDRDIPSRLYRENGVRNFNRFSPEVWRRMDNERNNKDSDWVLVIGARNDEKGVFINEPGVTNGVEEMIKKLNEMGIGCRYIEAFSVQDLQRRLEFLKSQGLKKASGFVLMSHGNEAGEAILGTVFMADDPDEDLELKAGDVLSGKIKVLEDLVMENAPGAMDMCYSKKLAESLTTTGVRSEGSEFAISGGRITPSRNPDGSLSFYCETVDWTPGGKVQRNYHV